MNRCRASALRESDVQTQIYHNAVLLRLKGIAILCPHHLESVELRAPSRFDNDTTPH